VRRSAIAVNGTRGADSIGTVIGPIDHVYYWTRDMDRAVGFYTDVVGFTLVHRAGHEWAELEAGPVRFALHGTEDDLPPGGTVVLKVAELDAARRTLEERGVTFDPFVGDVEGFARFATFRDPDGNPVQIIEYTS
jgi:catechol 2,3-dioxygenase-like lactoylglutathione lyase family enzyme